MKISSHHYILLGFGLLTLVITSFGYWYVYNTTISQSERHSVLIQEIKNSEDSNKHEARLIALSSSILSERRAMRSYFVSEEGILDFIKSIENISKDSSTEVVLSGVTADDLGVGGDGAVGHVRLRVDVKGNWLNVNKALSLIENLPYSISVSGITLRYLGAESVSSDKKSSVGGLLWGMSLGIDALIMK